ncbi:MAG: M1 family metallopeptidase [Candidatus Paceibacterota bacterium]|jgi:puromycin-sensitive aminopeptidase
MPNKSVRLTKNVIPKTYHIELKPDLENFTFSGIETIKLSIRKPTKVITLHSKEIEIDTVRIGDAFGKISYNSRAQTASFTFLKTIPKGETKLVLVFKGILNDKMRGFYRSKYEINKKEYHMATTQFEATDARRAFPCFDEPAHKAVFHVSLVVPKGKTAISNTLPVSVQEHEMGYDVVNFAPTPKMSTYLLAFIVGDFEYLEKKSKRGVIVRVYTIPGKKHQAKFALDTTVRVLDFYEQYFDIPYPLNTLDMIAIPDFSSLAMENWGAVTFREIGLLVDEKNTSLVSKERVAEVIAHELAHQWFGNLVTMEWWTHLWLNEGFASYIPYLVTEKLFPKWNIWERFSQDTQGIALRLDALRNTHSIEVTVHHPDEIGEIFDAVSYSKGASVIRMLADYLGEKDFRDGLRYYLKKHSYKNTETIHLWQAFEKVSKKPVARMMHNWTSKSGYPVIRASMKNGALSLHQERFFASPISKIKNKEHTVWQIPIGNFLLDKKTLKINFLRGFERGDAKTSGLFKLQKIRTGKKFDFQSFKLNFGETGMYRTAYSRELLNKLIKPVEDKTLSSSDRLGIVRDLFALAEAGIIPTTDALEFLSAYKNEDNYVVWFEIASGLARLGNLLAKTKSEQKLKDFNVKLFSPLVDRLGWDKKKNEKHTDALLRSLSLARAGNAGHRGVIAEAKKKFALMQSGKSLDPDIRRVVYSLVAQNGGMKEYNKFIDMYKKENLHEEKNRIGYSLGDFKDKKILQLACAFAMSKNVRPQDAIDILSGVGSNPLGRDIWWGFVKSNWKTLVSRYGEGGLALSRAVVAIGGSAENKHFKGIKAFFRTHSAPGAKRAIDQLLERLEGNVAWLKRDGKIIERFLKN